MADNSNLAVRLRRYDDSEEFRLKANRVETSVSNGLITDSILSAGSRQLLGEKLVLDLRRYNVDFVIQGMTPDDYPNSSQYDGSSSDTPDNDDYGFRDELLRASLEWGPVGPNKIDKLDYDGRTIEGVLTNLDINEDTEQRPGRTYEGTLEWTFINAYVS